MCTKKELPACPVETTLTMISDKWKVLILRDLLTGTKRFGELKKSLTGVSQKVLTSQLREMEENGLVERKAYPEVPAPGGVQPDPAGPEPEAHHGRYVGVGRTVQTTECVTARRAAAGLVLHRALYTRLITHYFGVVWRVPFGLLAVLCLFVAGAAALAVHGR